MAISGTWKQEDEVIGTPRPSKEKTKAHELASVEFRRLLAPFLLVVTIAFFAVGLTVYAAVNEINKLAEENSVHLVNSILEDKQKNLGQITLDYAWWDDTLVNIIIEFNPKWASDNIGEFLNDGFGIKYVWVVSPDNKVIYATKDGSPFPSDDQNLISEEISIMAESARKFPKNEPEFITGYIIMDGGVYLVASARITPYELDTIPDTARNAVLFTAWQFDKALLSDMSQKYLIPDLRLNIDKIESPLQLNLYSPLDAIAGQLIWRLDYPGNHVLGQYLPWASLIIFLLSVAGLLFFKNLIFFTTNLRIQNSTLIKMERELVSINKKLENSNETLHKQSITDALTNIFNRRYFDEAFEKEWKTAKRHGHSIALLIIDIDYFKPYNDNYGHDSGDTCLAKVAALLKENGNRSNDVVARFGGEEFVVLLPITKQEAAIEFAEKLRLVIEEEKIKHEYSKVSKYISVSIGVAAITPNKSSTPKKLFKVADENLYKAKENGRNRIWPTLTERS